MDKRIEEEVIYNLFNFKGNKKQKSFLFSLLLVIFTVFTNKFILCSRQKKEEHFKFVSFFIK